MSVERPRPLVAGNWKMNGLTASATVLTEIQEGFVAALRSKVDLAICPPATLIAPSADKAEGSGIAIGGQDCHAKESGAFTGDISAEMLADAGATCVLVGHSERRQYHRRDGCGGLRQGACRPSGRARRHRVRRRDQGGARGRQDAGRRPPAAQRLDSGRKRRRQYCGRLRARLGHRHRPDPDSRRTSRRSMRPFAPPSANLSARRSRTRCASSMAARSSRRTRRN